MDKNSEEWFIAYTNIITPLEGMTENSIENIRLKIAALTNYVKIHQQIKPTLIGKLNLIYVPEMFKFQLKIVPDEESV